MQVEGINQNSPQWIMSRVGHGTASHAGDMIAKPKRETTGELERRRKYRSQLAWERINCRAVQHWVKPEMQWGIDHQDAARQAYEIEKGVILEPGGWWLHDRISWFGASPDYLLPDGLGLVEIKCPYYSENHDEHFDNDWELDKDYEAQMTAQLAVTGRQYCDYVSYDPRWPEKLQLFVWRFKPEPAVLRGLEQEIDFFLHQVEQHCHDRAQWPKVVVMQKAAR